MSKSKRSKGKKMKRNILMIKQCRLATKCLPQMNKLKARKDKATASRGNITTNKKSETTDKVSMDTRELSTLAAVK